LLSDGDSNHSMRQSGGLSLAAGWTAATPYALPCGQCGNELRRITPGAKRRDSFASAGDSKDQMRQGVFCKGRFYPFANTHDCGSFVAK